MSWICLRSETSWLQEETSCSSLWTLKPSWMNGTSANSLTRSTQPNPSTLFWDHLHQPVLQCPRETCVKQAFHVSTGSTQWASMSAWGMWAGYQEHILSCWWPFPLPMSYLPRILHSLIQMGPSGSAQSVLWNLGIIQTCILRFILDILGRQQQRWTARWTWVPDVAQPRTVI